MVNIMSGIYGDDLSRFDAQGKLVYKFNDQGGVDLRVVGARIITDDGTVNLETTAVSLENARQLLSNMYVAARDTGALQME